MKKILILVLSLILIFPVKAKEKNIVNVYLIHSKTCAHCKEEIKFLNKVSKQYQNVRIYKYEIKAKETSKIIESIQNNFKIKVESVPITIIGNEYYLGYDSKKTPGIFKSAIDYYIDNGYIDKIGTEIGIAELPKENMSQNEITIKDYIKSQTKFTILFNLQSNKIDKMDSATLIGIKQSISLKNIIIIILIILMEEIFKLSTKNRMILNIVYYNLYTIEILSEILNKNKLVIKIEFILLILAIIYRIINKRKKNKKLYLTCTIVFLMTSLISSKVTSLLKRVLELNLATKLEYIYCTIIYITSYITMSLIIYYIICNIINQIKGRNKRKNVDMIN